MLILKREVIKTKWKKRGKNITNSQNKIERSEQKTLVACEKDKERKTLIVSACQRTCLSLEGKEDCNNLENNESGWPWLSPHANGLDCLWALEHSHCWAVEEGGVSASYFGIEIVERRADGRSGKRCWTGESLRPLTITFETMLHLYYFWFCRLSLISISF